MRVLQVTLTSGAVHDDLVMTGADNAGRVLNLHFRNVETGVLFIWSEDDIASLRYYTLWQKA